MKHIKLFEDHSDKPKLTLQELLLHLQDALDSMFVINIGGGDMDNYQFIPVKKVSDFNRYYLDPDDTYIEINGDDGTYLDFYLNNFSISKLREECNDILDKGEGISDDQSTIDKYEFLAQTILVELDKFDDSTKLPDDEFVNVASDWSYVCDTLGVKMSEETANRVRRLMDRYKLVKK
jgi:hypothetical protein